MSVFRSATSIVIVLVFRFFENNPRINPLNRLGNVYHADLAGFIGELAAREQQRMAAAGNGVKQDRKLALAAAD
jgi:hypothetical protein